MILHLCYCLDISGRTSFSFSGKLVLMPKSFSAWSHFKGCRAFVKISAAWRSVATYLINYTRAGFKLLSKCGQVHPVSALYVPHLWGVTFLGNEDSGLVIFVQHQLNRAPKQTLPQGQRGKALLIQGESERHDLGFGGGSRH